MNFIGVFMFVIRIRKFGSVTDQSHSGTSRSRWATGSSTSSVSAASGLLHGGLPAPQHRREAHFRSSLGEPRFDPGLPVGVLLAEEDQVAPLAVRPTGIRSTNGPTVRRPRGGSLRGGNRAAPLCSVRSARPMPSASSGSPLASIQASGCPAMVVAKRYSKL